MQFPVHEDKKRREEVNSLFTLFSMFPSVGGTVVVFHDRTSLTVRVAMATVI